MIVVSLGAILDNFISETLPEYIIANSLGSPPILSSVGARLLIDMKKAGAKGLNEGMGSCASRSTISRIDFAPPPAQTSTKSLVDDEGGIVAEIETVEV